jgi:hypothetical protein
VLVGGYGYAHPHMSQLASSGHQHTVQHVSSRDNPWHCCTCSNSCIGFKLRGYAYAEAKRMCEQGIVKHNALAFMV